MAKISIHLYSKTDQEIYRAEEQIVELSKRIDFYITEYSIEMLTAKLAKGDLVIPGYQRNFTWEEIRKAKFIESLLLGLPVPFLFFWEMGDGRLEIVDGSQRLRTILEFCEGGLTLTGLDSLTALDSFRFGDLHPSRQRKFMNRSIRGIVLNEHADEQARFDMFERINTGSKNAESAEVRRGALAGPFMSLIIRLAGRHDFVAIAPLSKKAESLREREELVSRFFAYGDGLDGYRDRPREFIFNYVKRMNELASASAEILDQYEARFVAMVDAVADSFPYGFGRGVRAKATPRARFEAIALGVDAVLRSKGSISAKASQAIGEWLDSEEFKDIVGSDGANAVSRLRGRISYVQSRLDVE